MIDPHRFSLFLGAAILLAIAPGPGMLYVLARTLAGGRREGVLSSLGTFLGGLVHVLAAATGLSIVLATSATAFAAVKYAGAAYLIYLGVRMIISARKDQDAEIRIPSGRAPKNPFWQGIATEVLNPKTAIFFLAFIPHLGRAEHILRPDRDLHGSPHRCALEVLRELAAKAAHCYRTDAHRLGRVCRSFRFEMTRFSWSVGHYRHVILNPELLKGSVPKMRR
jgi:threonine/homoserine/homoserine lactone efflux protein